MKLRVTSDQIELVDGPVIRHDEVARVNEYGSSKASGIEIIAKAQLAGLRRYRIFVPAAMPGYEEVKRIVREWISPEGWRKFDSPSR